MSKTTIPLIWDLPQVSPAVREWLRLRSVMETSEDVPSQTRALANLEHVEHLMSPAERVQARTELWRHLHQVEPSANQLFTWRICQCFDCRIEEAERCN